MLQQPDVSLRNALAHLIVDDVENPGPFKDATVHLFKNDVSPGPESELADFVEADFDGYAASGAIVWGTPISPGFGSAEITGDTKQFSATGDTTPNEIFGYFVLNSAGTDVLWAERFSESDQIVGDGDGLVVVPRYRLRAQL